MIKKNPENANVRVGITHCRIELGRQYGSGVYKSHYNILSLNTTDGVTIERSTIDTDDITVGSLYNSLLTLDKDTEIMFNLPTPLLNHTVSLNTTKSKLTFTVQEVNCE